MIGNIDKAWRRLEVRHLAALECTARPGKPEVGVRLHEAIDPQELTDLVLVGDLDIVFVGNPPLDDALARVHLLDDPYVLLVSDDHPLAAATNVDPAAVARLPL